MKIISDIRWKSLLINIAIPLTVGLTSSLIINNGFSDYEDVVKPPLSPPSWIFPVVWTLLYILMGISSYIVYEKDKTINKKPLIIYAVQLALNFFWPIFFFGFNAYFFSFIILITMIIFVALMIYLFNKENVTAAILQLPYLLWLIFAGYLNLMVFILN